MSLYMKPKIDEAYVTTSMLLLSSFICVHVYIERYMTYLNGSNHLLEVSIPNLFSIISM